MKKIAFLLIFCLLLVGCAPSRPVEQAVPSTAAQEETTSAPAQMSVTLYLPNDNADGFVTREVTLPREAPQDTMEQLIQSTALAEDILEQLVQAGALPEGVRVLSMDSGVLDLNSAFLSFLNSMGTSGEYVVMGSVVNTYLTAFDLERITITVEGNVPETGHSIYDQPLRMYE